MADLTITAADVRIVEERDATPAQRRIGECNSGIYCFDPRAVWPALDRLSPDNDQGELYLTDVIGLLARARRRVESVHVDEPLEVAGVNDRSQLARLEAVLRERPETALALMRILCERLGALERGGAVPA